MNRAISTDACLERATYEQINRTVYLGEKQYLALPNQIKSNPIQDIF